MDSVSEQRTDKRVTAKTLVLDKAKIATQWQSALDTAAQGHCVVVHAPPPTWSELATVGGPTIVTGPRAADGNNPLVERELEPARTHHGHELLLAQPGHIESSGGLATTQTALYTGNGPSALELRVGSGSILLIAHQESRTPRSAVLTKWLAEAGAVQADPVRTDKPAAHPSVPSVETHPAQWAPLLEHLPRFMAEASHQSALVTQAGKAGRHLPETVDNALVDFVDSSNPSGALLLRGVPIGHIPQTPATPSGAHKDDRTSEAVLLVVARAIGQPVGYLPEHRGELVQNISPTREGAQAQVSTSSAVTLAYHTEAAFHPHQPRHLMLLCLRGDDNAATTLCSVHALMRALSDDDIIELRKPQYTTGIDESYTQVRSKARSNPRAVLSGDPANPKLWLDVDLMEGLTPNAQKALEKIGKLTTELGTSVTLQAGDLLIVDNHKAVHGRSPFTPRYDGTDRWLQRAMTVADHTQADGERDERIISTRFLAI